MCNNEATAWSRPATGCLASWLTLAKSLRELLAPWLLQHEGAGHETSGVESNVVQCL